MIKKLLFVFLLTLAFFYSSALTLAQTQTSTPISNNSVKCDPHHKQIGGVVSGTIGTFGFEDVYCVTEDLEVPSGQTFNIERGTWLIFHPGQRMVVAGQLLADGGTIHPIRFVSSDAEGWEGIHFQDSAIDSWCTGCYVENIRPGGVGIQIDAPVNILTSLIRDVPNGTAISSTVPFTLSHTRIDYVDTGIYLSGQPTQSHITHMTMIRCEKGVVNRGQSLTFDNSIISMCNTGFSTELSGTTAVSYTLFHDYDQKIITEVGSQLIEGAGIFEAEPGFVDFPDDLTLRADSPAVNAADPQADYHREMGYNGGRADLGAYGNTWRAPQQFPKIEPAEFNTTVDKSILVGKPDETVTFTLRITNNSSVQEDFVLGSYTSGDVFAINGIYNDRYNRNEYRRFFEIEPNEQYQLDIGVHIPAYATNGMVHHIDPRIQGWLSKFTTEFQLTTVVSTATKVKRVAHLGLAPQDVFIQGDYAYVAAGREGLRIWDITELTAPTEVGFYAPQDDLFWSANKVVVKGHYAYVAAGQAGLRILDISDPTQLLEVGIYSVPGYAEDINLVGSFAYVTWPICHYPPCLGKLQIVDITDPVNPVGVNTYDKLQIRDIDIAGHYAYIATAGFVGTGGIHVLDISEPTSPVEVGKYEFGGSGGANGIIVHNGYAYLLGNYGGSGIVIDISNPKNLTKIGGWSSSKSISEISLVGHYLYLTGFNTAAIFDVSDPTHPIEVTGNHEALNYTKSIKVVNSHAYLAAGTAGLRIIDISNPIKPKPLEVFEMQGFAQAIAVMGNYAYVADIYNGLRILDISKPLTPTEVVLFDKLGGASDIEIKGHYAYVNFGKCEGPDECDTNLHVLDISNPVTPVEIDGYKKWREFKIIGNYAYVLDEAKWLHIFDISNPAVPKEVNTLKESVNDFALANGYLYLLPSYNFQFTDGQSSFTQDSQLKILDPISLTEISSFNLPNEYPAREVIVANDYAYIRWVIPYTMLRVDGWVSVDISNPTAPVLRGDVHKPQYIQPATVDGHHAYFAAERRGLRIFDMADSQNPVEVDAYGANAYETGIMDVAVAKSYIYLAGGSNGLSILRYPEN